MHKQVAGGAVRLDDRGALEKTTIAETWQQYYETRGYELWGFSPSPTAKILAQAILASGPRRSERVEVIDWGCGYGRDSLYFVELGFDVIGIDVSEKAIRLARNAYKERQASGIPLAGSASFHTGDMPSVFKNRAGQKVRAFFSNRVIHLLGESVFCDTAREAVSYLEEGAYFCVSGRSRDDFNTTLMEWIPGKENEMARYKDPTRTGHDITFVTRECFRRAAGQHLKNTRYLNATEPERVGASDTHLLILIAQTRPRATSRRMGGFDAWSPPRSLQRKRSSRPACTRACITIPGPKRAT